jgi:sulfate permease, SulP family
VGRLDPPHPPRIAGALDLAGDGRSPRELFAGVTLAALALPLNIGYATAAGFPPTVGIYATLLPLLVFAVTSGSRHLAVGPDATIAALLAAVVAPIVAAGADPAEVAWASALCVGATLLLFWALRLGGLVRFVSKAVLVGFIAGLGIEVLTSQIRKIMDVELEPAAWPVEVVELVRSIPDASSGNVVVAVVTIAGLRLAARAVPRLPGALLVLAVVTVAVAALEPDDVGLLGSVPSGLPVPTFPTLGADIWFDLIAIAVAIAVLTTAEGALIAQREARRHGETIDPNGELFALGASNVAAGLSGSMPIGASASRTAALSDTGSRTQVPAIVAALCVALVLLFLTDVVAQLPNAALAALVANAVVSTIEVHEVRRFGRLRRSELVIALSCTAGVLLIGPIGGLVLAVVISAIDVVRRAADAPWTQLAPSPDDPSVDRFRSTDHAAEPVEGLRVVRPGGPLFFANADEARAVLERAADDPDVRWIVLDLETVSDVDPTAAAALSDGIRAAHANDTVVALSRVTRPIRSLLASYGIIAAIGEHRIYATNREVQSAFVAAGSSTTDGRDDNPC